VYRSFLSWRYLFARRTNLIGVMGILVGVFALILILSIMTGFLAESRRVVRGSLSDVLIVPYQGDGPGTTIAADPGAILSTVRADPRVAGATGQLVWGGMITVEGKKLDPAMSSKLGQNPLVVQLVGVDVASVYRLAWSQVRAIVAAVGIRLPQLDFQDEYSATDLLPALTGALPRVDDPRAKVKNPLFPFARPERYRPRGRPKAAVVLGDQLFDGLELRVGQEIQIGTIVQDPVTGKWELSNREFVVAGTFRSGENESDQSLVYLDRRELADFLGGFRQYTHVLLRLHDYERDGRVVAAEVYETLLERGLLVENPSPRFPQVRTWEQFRGNTLGAIKNERVLMAIMLSLVLLVAGFTIFAILSMMVTEKRRDIGVLLALGATPRGLLDLFLMVAFWDALLGTIFGTLLGVWAALEIDNIERSLSSAFGVQIFDRSVYLFDYIPAIVEPIPVAMIVAGAFLCPLLFSTYPAWRAARLDPLEALRYE